MASDRPRLNISFSFEQMEDLRNLSDKRGQSIASIVRALVRDGLNRIAEAHLARKVKKEGE